MYATYWDVFVLNCNNCVLWKLVIVRLENLEILKSGKRENSGPQTPVILECTLQKLI
jgi:hypothetical protein